MEVADALERITQIHDQIAKGELYRGFRPVPIAASGVAGLLAAYAQSLVVHSDDPQSFLIYWVSVGAGCGLLGISEILYNYVVHDDSYTRRCTSQVAGQFIPCIAAAVAATLALWHGDVSVVSLLPGLWAMAFSLGVFAARPYMPRATGWVALYYLLCGAWLLFTRANSWNSGWHVGGIFGIGQIASAAVLYWNLERKSNV